MRGQTSNDGICDDGVHQQSEREQGDNGHRSCPVYIPEELLERRVYLARLIDVPTPTRSTSAERPIAYPNASLRPATVDGRIIAAPSTTEKYPWR